MAESSLDTEFRTAVTENGDTYRAARKAILARGTAALGFLDSQHGSNDWKTSVTADILAGWIKTPKLFEQCTDAVEGKLSGRLPITGTFLARRRIAEIERLGKGVTPRLLEMAWKTREYGGPTERESIFGGLTVLKDGRAVLPLIELMQTAPDQGIRGWAASTLGALKDSRAVQPLSDVLRSKTVTPEVQAAAAMSLGTLGAKQAAPELRSIAVNDLADMEVRKSAIRSLGELGDSASAEPLLGLLAKPHELAFDLALLESIGKLGQASILPALTEIEKNHSEAPVREAAKEAADEINERAEAKRK